MADNLDITAGTGTTVATDQVGSVHYQKVKLVDGTADSSTVITAGGGVEAGALRVTVASDSTGVLSVDDNGGALTVDGTVTANLSATDNAVLDAIAASDASIDGKITACNTGAVVLAAGTAAIGKLAANTGVDIGDVDVLSIAAGTNLIGKIGIDQVTANANEVVVKSGTVTAVTALTNALPAGDNNIGNVDIVTVPAPLSVVGGGTEAAAMRVTIASDSTGVLSVDDNGGALTVDGAVTASNCAGDIASDSADSGNPVKVGGKAVNMDGTVPGTAVAEADRANFITDLYGRQLVDTTHPNFWSAIHAFTEATTAHEIVAAPGAGLSLYLTDVILSNGAVAGNMKIIEDTAAAADKIGVLYFAINGGAVINFKTPIKFTANKNLGLTSVTCTTHTITVSGYTAP